MHYEFDRPDTRPCFSGVLISSIETYPRSYIPQEIGKPKRLKNKSHEGESMGLLLGQRLIKGEHGI